MKLEDRLNEAGAPIGIHRVSFEGNVVNNIAEKDSRTEAREAIYKDLDARIVEVESMFELEEYSKEALIACAELRKAISDYCGVDTVY